MATACLATVALALSPGATAGQGGAERVVWRGLLGETALEVRAVPGNVKIGAAGDSAAVSVTLRSTDVRRFVDSLARRLAPNRLRDSTWTLRIEEPGVSPGAFSVSPEGRGPDRQRRYRMFIADDVLTAVRQSLDTREVTLLLRTLRAASQPPRRPAGVHRPGAVRRAPASGRRRPSA